MANIVEIGASPKHLSKLRNGHSVILRRPPPEGRGVYLVVHPDNYDLITRTFSRNKGLQFTLSPEEILANQEASSQMSGKGIFGKTFDRGVRKLVGKKAQKAIYGAARDFLPLAQAGLTAGLTSGATALGVAQPELIPFLPAGVAGLSALGSDYLANPSAYQTNVGGPKARLATNLAGRMLQDRALQEINNATGANLGNLSKASIGNALANKMTAEFNKKAVQQKQQQQQSLDDVYANMFTGNGLYAASGKGIGMKIYGGSTSKLLNLNHPALRSQPFAENFQFGNTLPPAYQKFSKGSGLYI